MITMEQFAKIPLFSGVEWEGVQGYFQNIPVLTLQKGEVLISPKSTESYMYILLQGECKVSLESAESDAVGRIFEGDCVGEMSVIDNQKPSAWVVADEPCMALQMSGEIALAMIHSSHDLCLNLLSLLSFRLRRNNEVRQKDVQLFRKIQENATVDSLTGLHNRRWMETMFPREIHRCLSGSYTLTGMMIDLDHFKSVNDNYGHLVGDQVLRCTSEAIHKSLRPTDLVVRYGGEEIAVLLPTSDVENAAGISERILGAIRKLKITLDSGETLMVTASIGFSEIRKGDTMETLLQRADKALYESKRNGRDRYSHF